jgi:polar amino acid transport system substrate-binding protein
MLGTLSYLRFYVASCLPVMAIGSAHSVEVLRLCFESATVHPWRSIDQRGLNFELINAAARSLGVQVEYLSLPWKRCLLELKANGVDGAFAASFLEERTSYAVYPGGATPDAARRLHFDSYVLLRRKGTRLNWDGRSFSGLSGPVGIQLGYSVGDQLRRLDIPLDEGSVSASELLEKLKAGRVDGAALLSDTAKNLMHTQPHLANALDILPVPLVQKPYFLVFSFETYRSRKGVADSMWRAIEQVRNTPAYRRHEASMLQSGGQP